MPPKRKSNVLEPSVDLTADESQQEAATQARPAMKKARTSDVAESSSTGAKKGKGKAKVEDNAPNNWWEVKLPGEDERGVLVFDDCNEIRCKIRLLQKEPGFKVTHWLQAIGNINNNSYQRFMKATGPTGGASNGTYYSAYVYFEKVRIATGKKKTAKRTRNEAEYKAGMPLEDRKTVWIMGR
ncbi:uncharacterized protein PHACADRAFT_206919 [Phanerochaete carnosa HHB-10118-sp]|uniref:DUF7726 domain-containing protein n=1 Tax=Phanerochaete carnosa (strain HHB-10118-sp) TaxID=650164 RepID=K5WG55_PHACS|nr:uncharacterized protein PHACADRAFT_206919 [Phanerochaete carnosa HHB-10118-sp]EKM58079.1 hypothetical protein PHACADRAFT_206919 [Phanerochaete carnosa HHB-10118-sp]